MTSSGLSKRSDCVAIASHGHENASRHRAKTAGVRENVADRRAKTADRHANAADRRAKTADNSANAAGNRPYISHCRANESSQVEKKSAVEPAHSERGPNASED